MASKYSPYTGEKLVEGVNADRRGGKLRARDPYEGMYDSATKALTDYATSLQSDQPTMESDIQAGAETQRKTVRQQKEAGIGKIGTQRESATRASESAVAEARRVAAEQMQGLQARFGSSTGTGGFTGEILGRETARNIAGERGALQGRMGELDVAERDLITQADNQIFQIDTQANQAVNESRRQLRDQLAQINMKKGELEADKASRRIQALQNYQLTLRQIEAQKEQAQQAVKADMEKMNRELAIWKEKEMFSAGLKGGTGGAGGAGGIDTTGLTDTTTARNVSPTGGYLYGQYFNNIPGLIRPAQSSSRFDIGSSTTSSGYGF